MGELRLHSAPRLCLPLHSPLLSNCCPSTDLHRSPCCRAGEHFVDDETSRTLFLGYACCASELADQLRQEGVTVDATSPLVVHVPCGVGGAPSGILYGLKLVFGEHVHVYFAEPCNAPCVTLSLASGLNERVAVADIGLSCKTEADGARAGVWRVRVVRDCKIA